MDKSFLNLHSFQLKRYLSKLLLATLSVLFVVFIPKYLFEKTEFLGSVFSGAYGNFFKELVNVILLGVIICFFPSKLGPANPSRKLFPYLVLLPIALINIVKGPFECPDAKQLTAIALRCFLVGLWEEFLFRGFIQAILLPLGFRAAVLGSALLFSLCHAQSGGFAIIVSFIIGLSFSLAKEHTGVLL